MNTRLAVAALLAVTVLTTQSALAHDGTAVPTATTPSATIASAATALPSLGQTTAIQAQLLRQLKDATLQELQQQLDPVSITVEMLKTANRVLFGTLHKLQNTL